MFKIVENRTIWYAVSGILVGVSILSIVFFGFNQSIDFTGGSLWEIKTSKSLSVGEVRTFLSGYISGDIVVQPTEEGLIMRFKTIDEETHQKIYADFTQKFGLVVENRFESIGPVIGQELKKKSTISVILVAIAIILYVAWAFRKVSKPVNSWFYGSVTIVSLLHDVMIRWGFSLFWENFSTLRSALRLLRRF
jgi:preprotein translocase subunit SecF